jgi:hypothetical protein
MFAGTPLLLRAELFACNGRRLQADEHAAGAE